VRNAAVVVSLSPQSVCAGVDGSGTASLYPLTNGWREGSQGSRDGANWVFLDQVKNSVDGSVVGQRWQCNGANGVGASGLVADRGGVALSSVNRETAGQLQMRFLLGSLASLVGFSTADRSTNVSVLLIPAPDANGWCVATKEEEPNDTTDLRPRLEVEVCQ
jgi:hypothetical protein